MSFRLKDVFPGVTKKESKYVREMVNRYLNLFNIQPLVQGYHNQMLGIVVIYLVDIMHLKGNGTLSKYLDWYIFNSDYHDILNPDFCPEIRYYIDNYESYNSRPDRIDIRNITNRYDIPNHASIIDVLNGHFGFVEAGYRLDIKEMVKEHVEAINAQRHILKP